MFALTRKLDVCLHLVSLLEHDSQNSNSSVADLISATAEIVSKYLSLLFDYGGEGFGLANIFKILIKIKLNLI